MFDLPPRYPHSIMPFSGQQRAGCCIPFVSERMVIMQGSARVNDTVELPQLRLQRKIRSMQMFRKPQQRCTRVCSSLPSHLHSSLLGLLIACEAASVATLPPM